MFQVMFEVRFMHLRQLGQQDVSRNAKKVLIDFYLLHCLCVLTIKEKKEWITVKHSSH